MRYLRQLQEQRYRSIKHRFAYKFSKRYRLIYNLSKSAEAMGKQMYHQTNEVLKQFSRAINTDNH